RQRLPLPSLKVPRELLRSFPHSKRVGSYLVGKMINKGSFAKVMEGLHISTGEKTLETENSYYMVMELCAGGDLMDRICERKRLEEREVRRYTRQILSAVEHLHKHGIVHDLKIENFLLDEHNNIKIVFGLSNTLKTDSLSLELLSTQCGSPAYAAPELLAHRKYGPKVDVWSGVSMFAMLTGTLPFTVEPFNIKQLHQKMVNGEISSIPGDISKLSSEDLNSTVLEYMTETLGYSLSEIIHVVTTNRPSALTASYHLLLSRLNRSQRGAKASK
uniref:non-specific serine/threonine protein kinase n=1 Tax=Pundamilia nyererei TaxID=303518 RepID=A0A3B4H2L3_9CICH